MKSEPDEIHFDCPKCKRPMSGDKTLLGEMINCPDCNEPFIPVPNKPEPEPIAEASGWERVSSPPRVFTKTEKIQNMAYLFTAAAILFFIIGCLTGFGSFCLVISGEGAGIGYIIAASLIGISLWFYLIAQIVHIRANTEK
jgi:hypothetical protein